VLSDVCKVVEFSHGKKLFQNNDLVFQCLRGHPSAVNLKIINETKTSNARKRLDVSIEVLEPKHKRLLLHRLSKQHSATLNRRKKVLNNQ